MILSETNQNLHKKTSQKTTTYETTTLTTKCKTTAHHAPRPSAHAGLGGQPAPGGGHARTTTAKRREINVTSKRKQQELENQTKMIISTKSFLSTSHHDKLDKKTKKRRKRKNIDGLFSS